VADALCAHLGLRLSAPYLFFALPRDVCSFDTATRHRVAKLRSAIRNVVSIEEACSKSEKCVGWRRSKRRLRSKTV
jgi:hypothetical protein